MRDVFYTSALTGEGIAALEEGLARAALGMEPLKRDGTVDIDDHSDEDSELENPSGCVC